MARTPTLPLRSVSVDVVPDAHSGDASRQSEWVEFILSTVARELLVSSGLLAGCVFYVRVDCVGWLGCVLGLAGLRVACFCVRRCCM